MVCIEIIVRTRPLTLRVDSLADARVLYNSIPRSGLYMAPQNHYYNDPFSRQSLLDSFCAGV